jgi:hypothetical protein
VLAKPTMIANDENFRGVAQFYSGDSAVAQSSVLPSIATNRRTCQCNLQTLTMKYTYG